MSTQFQPDTWLTSTYRALKEFVEAQVDAYVLDNLDQPAGLDAYEIVFDWPSSDEIAHAAELNKTIIHFIADDIDNRKLGFGDDVVNSTEEIHTPTSGDLLLSQEGQGHTVNFYVGIWASDKSGGATSRLVVYEMLQRIFNFQSGRERTREETGGVEVIHFNGGRFITDTINDIRCFRIIDCELVVRVYSRMTQAPVVIIDQETEVIQNLEIDDITIS